MSASPGECQTLGLHSPAGGHSRRTHSRPALASLPAGGSEATGRGRSPPGSPHLHNSAGGATPCRQVQHDNRAFKHTWWMASLGKPHCMISRAAELIVLAAMQDRGRDSEMAARMRAPWSRTSWLRKGMGATPATGSDGTTNLATARIKPTCWNPPPPTQSAPL